MITPLLHRLGIWDGVSPERLIAHGLSIHKIGASGRGAYFAVNSEKFRRSTECELFKTMRNGFVAPSAVQPPILYAARDGHREAIKLLAQYEADVNEVGGIPFETALHVAVQSHKLKVVQMLLSLRADPQIKDAGGQGPLHRAAREGAIHSLQTLITAGATVDMRDTCEQAPIHLATYFGREEVVRALLAARADAVAENIRGQTPRKVAERLGYTTIVQIIDKEIERREIEELYAAEERDRAEQQLKALLEAEGTENRPTSKASKRSGRSSGGKSSRPSTRQSTRILKK
eukprot:s810_g3.t1